MAYQSALENQRAADRAAIAEWSRAVEEAKRNAAAIGSAVAASGSAPAPAPGATQQAAYLAALQQQRAQQAAGALPPGGVGWAAGAYNQPTATTPARLAAGAPRTPGANIAYPPEVAAQLANVLGNKTPLARHMTRAGKVLKMTPSAIRGREKNAYNRLVKEGKIPGVTSPTPRTTPAAAGAKKKAATSTAAAAPAASVRVKAEEGATARVGVVGKTKAFFGRLFSSLKLYFFPLMFLINTYLGYTMWGLGLDENYGDVGHNILLDALVVIVLIAATLYIIGLSVQTGAKKTVLAVPSLLGAVLMLFCWVGGTAGLLPIFRDIIAGDEAKADPPAASTEM